MSILLVTVDSGRPKCFDILQKAIKRQTKNDFHWLYVVDNWEGYKFPTNSKNFTLVKRDKTDDKLTSMNENWLTALDWIEQHDEFEKVLVIESDDYYSPTYVLETTDYLDRCELFGWDHDAYYYVISRKARRTLNVEFAALASTAFKRSVLPYFRKCVELGTVYIDKPLWHGIKENAIAMRPPIKLENGQIVQAAPEEYVRTVDKFKGVRLLANNFTGLPSGQSPKLSWVEGKLHLSRVEPELDDKGNIADEYPRHVGMKEPWHGGSEGASDHNPLVGGGPDMYGDKLRQWIGKEPANWYLSLFKDPPGRDGRPYPPFVLCTLPTEKDTGI